MKVLRHTVQWFAIGYIMVALFFAAWPNAEELYWKIKSGQAWIGTETARIYLQDPADWMDSVVTYGFPLQRGGHIVPHSTKKMLNVMWTSPEWAGRDISFVCVESSDGVLGWIEVAFSNWVEDAGPGNFQWETKERGGLYWPVECEADWRVGGFSPAGGFPATGYIEQMEWNKMEEGPLENTA